MLGDSSNTNEAHSRASGLVEVAVVIPVRNDAGGLAEAVESVSMQRGPFTTEILICVGPSADDTAVVAAKLAEQPQVTVLANDHGGIPQALNLGLRASTTDVLARVDARCVLPDGYLARAIRTLSSSGAANVGARQVPVGQTDTERAIAAAMSHRLGSGGASYRHSGNVRMVDTAFLGVFDTERLRAAGGWDERFERNEDAELNARLANHGGVYLDPELAVEYRPRTSLRGLGRQYFDYGWWRFRTAKRHPRSLAVRQLAAPAIVVVIATSLVLSIFNVWALIAPLVYLLALATAAASTSNLGWSQRATMAAALATMHLAWGLGFLASASRPTNRVQQ